MPHCAALPTHHTGPIGPIAASVGCVRRRPYSTLPDLTRPYPRLLLYLLAAALAALPKLPKFLKLPNLPFAAPWSPVLVVLFVLFVLVRHGVRRFARSP